MTSPKLKQLGFVDAQEREVADRLIISVCGTEKEGKTHFSLTAPDPIAFFSTDIGEEGVIQKFSDKKINLIDIDVEIATDTDPELVIEITEKEWEKFYNAYVYCLQAREIKTIVIDTATEMWELLRMSRFGKLANVKSHHYGPVNAEYRRIIRKAYKHDKNLILLHKMKDEYKKDVRTGNKERAGFKDTGFLVQVNALIYKWEGEFTLEIENCRYDPELDGEELEGPLCNFDVLKGMVLG